MNGNVDDIGYGKQFAAWYDRLFPKDANAVTTAETLAHLHPDPEKGTLEFGVGTGRIAVPLSQRSAASSASTPHRRCWRCWPTIPEAWTSQASTQTSAPTATTAPTHSCTRSAGSCPCS